MYTVVAENTVTLPYVYSFPTYREAAKKAQETADGLSGATRVAVYGPAAQGMENYQGIVKIFYPKA